MAGPRFGRGRAVVVFDVQTGRREVTAELLRQVP